MADSEVLCARVAPASRHQRPRGGGGGGGGDDLNEDVDELIRNMNGFARARRSFHLHPTLGIRGANTKCWCTRRLLSIATQQSGIICREVKHHHLSTACSVKDMELCLLDLEVRPGMRACVRTCVRACVCVCVWGGGARAAEVVRVRSRL